MADLQADLDLQARAKPTKGQYAQRTFMKYSSADIAQDSSGAVMLLSGNEALARGCIEAGVRVAGCYPGSPVTYVLDNLVEAAKAYPSMHVEWSVNEKVAYEVALGAAMTGVRGMCVFKNVGLEVALDALANSVVELGPGGLVLVVNDDPGMNATQSEVDVRYLALYSSTPILEPTDMQEAKDYTAAAFELSERLHAPVLVRPIYSMAYAREPVALGAIDHEARERKAHYDVRDWHAPQKAVAEILHLGPNTWPHAYYHGEAEAAGRLRKGWPTEKATQEAIDAFPGNELRLTDKARVGLITCGLAHREAMEALKTLGNPEEVALLKLATTFPLPLSKLKRLLERTETVLVIEEIEPFVEDQVRAFTAQLERHAQVIGKRSGHIPYSGDVKAHHIGPVVGQLIGKDYQPSATAEKKQRRAALLSHLPSDAAIARQCPGCPGYGAAYALRHVAQQLGMWGKLQFFGYDGCCGGIPRGESGITLCMGAGVNLASGMNHAGLEGKQVALCGDSNFFHAFMPGLVNAIYNKADVLFYVMDNSTTAMTGHQPHPGAFGITAGGDDTKQLDIAEIARAFQADYVAVTDPYNQQQTFEVLRKALTTKGVSVVVSRRLCAIVAQRQKGSSDALIFERKSQVNRERCLSWTVQMAPCQSACPAHIDVEGYVQAIARGEFERALQIIRDSMPFAGVCGRVCYAPCETDCKRARFDEAVAIRQLKRFVADYQLQQGTALPSPAPRTHQEKVAVVGGGPAGLAAAYDLARLGYGVTVFEAGPEAGGVLMSGIPEYRLPKEVVRHEVNIVRALGVEIRTGTRIGEGLPLADLRKEYQALFIATGTSDAQKLGVPGEDAKGVVHGLHFLRALNTGGSYELGKKVAVIGGGNTAIDAARAAKRLGASPVTVVYARTQRDMPAFAKEVREAQEEGIEFAFRATPVRVITRGDGVAALECVRTAPGQPDDSGRPRPVPVRGSEFRIEVDTVVEALGQGPELGFTGGLGLLGSAQGALVVDEVTLATSVPGVFAGGEVAGGVASVIDCIAAGKRAAVSIHRHLRSEDMAAGRVSAKPVYTGASILRKQVLERPRQRMAELDMAQRTTTFGEVELGYTMEQARQEALRCMKCKTCTVCFEEFGCIALTLANGHPTIDQDLCVACGMCNQVCPYGNIGEVI